jgi:hypothetical protein
MATKTTHKCSKWAKYNAVEKSWFRDCWDKQGINYFQIVRPDPAREGNWQLGNGSANRSWISYLPCRFSSRKEAMKGAPYCKGGR